MGLFVNGISFADSRKSIEMKLGLPWKVHRALDGEEIISYQLTGNVLKIMLSPSGEIVRIDNGTEICLSSGLQITVGSEESRVVEVLGSPSSTWPDEENASNDDPLTTFASYIIEGNDVTVVFFCKKFIGCSVGFKRSV